VPFVGAGTTGRSLVGADFPSTAEVTIMLVRKYPTGRTAAVPPVTWVLDNEAGGNHSPKESSTPRWVSLMTTIR
jgi:hypothetical protein